MVKVNSCLQEEPVNKFILGVDIGTTNIRCYVYDNKGNVAAKTENKIKLLYPERCKVEIAPDFLWQNFVNVVDSSLKSAKLMPNEVTCMGISTQRSTFITWDKETGEPFHNFITWKDRRADKLCNEWNHSLIMRLFRSGAYLLYLMTRNQRFLAASILKLTSTMVLMRFVWVLQNIPEVREKASKNAALFGTIETWLIWKLTGGKEHVTDGSNACVTGFFDPFLMVWAKWAINMFHLPVGLFPKVKNTSSIFGQIMPEIFGASIPIRAVIGDQQSSTFGNCCFNSGDINCTLGTGTFINLNTGSSPLVTHKDIYPLVGWTINDKTYYIAECGTYDTGTIISLAQNLGLFDHPEESCGIASSVPDNGGVYFISVGNNFYDRDLTTSSIVGLKAQTTKAHVVRSILEAQAFQVYLFYELVTEAAAIKVQTVRVCGGVARNDFIVQLISDLTQKPVIRSRHYDTSCLGAAFLAGLSSGVWSSIKELKELPKNDEIFSPQTNNMKYYQNAFQQWKKYINARTFNTVP